MRWVQYKYLALIVSGKRMSVILHHFNYWADIELFSKEQVKVLQAFQQSLKITGRIRQNLHNFSASFTSLHSRPISSVHLPLLCSVFLFCSLYCTIVLLYCFIVLYTLYCLVYWLYALCSLSLDILTSTCYNAIAIL